MTGQRTRAGKLGMECLEGRLLLAADLFEPNDSFGDAASLGTGDKTYEQLSIHESQNDDWYEWTASADGNLRVDVLFSDAMGDIELELRDSDGESSLAKSETSTDNETIEYEVVADHVYLILVSGFFNDVNDYTLVINGPELEPDDLEPNDAIGVAADMQTGDKTASDLSIHQSQNDDWYQWKAPADGDLTAEAGFSHALGNIDLEIYGPDQSLLVTSSSDSDNESATTAVLADQTYFVRVFGAGGDIQRDYDLSLNGPDLTPDAFEPNDASTAATDLQTEDQTHVGLSIHQLGNDDWYKWRSPASGTLTLDALFSHASGDVNLEIYDSSMSLLGSSTTQSDNERLSRSVAKEGLYFIRVFGAPGALQADYTLSIDGPEPPVFEDKYEPNDTFTNPANLGLIDQTQRLLTLHDADDEDWYKWTPRADGMLTVEALFNHEHGDVSLQLYDASQTLVAESASTTDNEQLTTVVEAGEKYVIRVFAAAGEVQRRYDLVIDGPEILPDEFEPNDTFASAYDLGTRGQTHEGLTIHESNNDDWYQWTATLDGPLSVEIHFRSGLGDLELALYDANQMLLDDSITSNDNERVESDVIAGETYYIQVGGSFTFTQPDYDLIINGPGPDKDQFEPNDTLTDAFDLGTGDLSSKGLTIHEMDNNDWYRWTAAAAGTLTVDTLFSNVLGDLSLEVYDSNDALVAQSATTTDDEHVSLPVVAGEAYSLRVYGVQGAIQPSYSLVIDGPGPGPDQFEPNDTFGQAADLGTGNLSVKNLSMHGPDNDDWYKWRSPAAGPLTVDLAFTHADGDLNLELYDASETLLDESTSTTDNEQISTNIAGGRLYFLRVFGEVQDRYDLIVDSNSPPTVSDIGAQSVNEDTTLAGIEFTISDDETPADLLIVTATSSNADLVSSSGLTVTGSTMDRTLAIVPNANQSGETTITVQVRDAFGAVETQSFPLTVNAVADQPQLNVSNGSGQEDAAIPLTISSSLTDSDGSEKLAIRIGGVPTEASLSAGIDNGDGSWTLEPTDLTGLTITPPQHDSSQLSLTVVATATENSSKDSASRTASLLVDVEAVADAPSLTVNDTSGEEDSAIPLSIGAVLVDADGSENLSIEIAGVPAGATLSAGTNNGDGSWSLSAADLSGLTVTPPPSDDSEFALTVTATATETTNDDNATSTAQATVTVNPVNDLPTISGISDTSVNEDSSTTAIPFTVGDAETAPGQLIVSATSDDQTLVSNTNIVAAGSGADRSLTLTPVANQHGSATITVLVTDGNGGNTSESFALTVVSVNDSPTVVGPIGTVAVNEDAADSSVDLSSVFADVDFATGAETLTFSVSNNSDPSLVASSISANALTLNYLPNQHGTASVVVRATDAAGAWVQDTVSVSVASVNDTPVFTSPAAVAVLENTTAVTTVTASDVDGDTLTYLVSGGQDQAAFRIDGATGVLEFRSAPNFEVPGDADGDNVYDVHVAADDGNIGVVKQIIQVTVSNSDESLPTVDVVGIVPDPRWDVVGEVSIVFSEAVTGLDLSDLTFTRSTDGVVSLLPGSATLTTADNVTWRLGNLGDASRASGIYDLTVVSAGSGIVDAGGNPLSSNASERWTNGAGDANEDGQFNQLDVIATLQASKYLTGQAATWSQGDFNGDNVFDQFDVILSQQTQPPHYLQGPLAARAVNEDAATEEAATAIDVALLDLLGAAEDL